MRRQWIIILPAVLALAVWILAMLPGWLAETDSPATTIDWVNAADDPEQHLTYTLVQAATYSEAMLEDNAHAKHVLEKRFNVTLNYTGIDPVAYNRKGPLSWAAGIIPDVFGQAFTSLASSARHGFIIPIPLEVLVRYAPTYARLIDDQTDIAWMVGRVAGKQYCLPKIYPDGLRPIPGLWRKDWLEAVGIGKTPDSIDEYTTAFQLFKENKPDARSFIRSFGGALTENQKQQVLEQANPTWGMSGDIIHWRDGMFTEIFGAYDVQPFQWSLTGEDLQWGGISDGAKRALQQLSTWYQSGYIHPDFAQDHHSREVLQKLYSSIVGYISYWSSYVELHPDRVRVQTMGALQRDRDKKRLMSLGMSEAETETLLAETADRYKTLWTPGLIPAGPEGYRGNRVSGALGQWTMPFVFGRQMAKHPEKVIRWLRIIETVLTDEDLMIQLSLGKEEQHWRWQAPDEIILKEESGEKAAESRGEYGVFSRSSYPESTIVALPPYDGWLKRQRQGLTYDLWAPVSAELLGVPASTALENRYQSGAQQKWNETYRPKELADKCVFGDAEALAPAEIAPIIKRLIAFQQSAYAAFIKGDRELEEWDDFVEAFQSLGGEEVLNKMRDHYREIQNINTKVDSMLTRDPTNE